MRKLIRTMLAGEGGRCATKRCLEALAGAALALLIAMPALADTPSSKAAFAAGELNLVGVSAAYLENPLAQGPAENPDKTEDGKNDGNGICTFPELVAGGCKKNEEINKDGALTVIDGNGICDTEEPGGNDRKNRLGIDELLNGGCYAAGEEDKQYASILSKYIKAPNGKDLWMNVSLECGNFTHTSVRSEAGELDTSAASAMVRVRVKVTNLRTGEVGYALPDGNSGRPDLPVGQFFADDGKGVVFCRRSQTLMAKFQGIIEITQEEGTLSNADLFHECLVNDPATGNVVLDAECLVPEEVTLIVDQMQANAFNFLYPNVDSGVHQIDVEAWLDTDSGAEAGDASAVATVGLGSMVVQVLRLVKDDEGASESLPVELQ